MFQRFVSLFFFAFHVYLNLKFPSKAILPSLSLHYLSLGTLPLPSFINTRSSFPLLHHSFLTSLVATSSPPRSLTPSCRSSFILLSVLPPPSRLRLSPDPDLPYISSLGNSSSSLPVHGSLFPSLPPSTPRHAP